MPVDKTSFSALKAYIPDGSFDKLMELIEQYKVHLTVTQERKSKLGDFRNAYKNKNHRISVNGNLNKYAFLLTLLHELAHLLAYEKYGHTIPAHGFEWKETFAKLLVDFLKLHIFPQDIAQEIIATLNNPAATTGGEEKLQRVLKKYDTNRPNTHIFVDEVAIGAHFKFKNSIYLKKGKLRKRNIATELSTGKDYLFNPICEVVLIESMK